MEAKTVHIQIPPLKSRVAQAQPRPTPLSLHLWFQVGDEYLRKQHRVLADLHYGQAGRLFQLLKDTPCELLRVQLERVAFAEFQMSSKSRLPPQSGRRRRAGSS